MTTIVPASATAGHSAAGRSAPDELPWQREVRRAVRCPAELCRLLDLPATFAEAARQSVGDFPLFVPQPYLARIRPGDPADPLLRQVLPLAAERQSPAGFLADPVDDRGATVVPGLVRKYRGRALMVTTGACAVHCRYCFRRHFPYDEAPRGIDQWQPALDAIAADRTLHEVILSGGDPLMLVDAQLGELARRLAAIGHLTRLRVHTRLPVMIPQRVDRLLLDWLRGTRLVLIVVIHANHAAELDESVAGALARLADAGVPLLNQSVLLRGVNDSALALCALSERLIELRVMPYYLHQLDRVAGAAHFEVPVSEGRRLVRQLRALLPGYAVPHYVREQPGAPSKTPLG